MTCGIIIPAAGQGKRMGIGINKQFIKIHDKPILIHTVEKFMNIDWITEIVVVAHPDEMMIVESMFLEYGLSIKAIVPGGLERQDSIYNGLSVLETEYVMVHDGARPFIKEKQLNLLWEAVQKNGSAVLGVPVKETIKVVDEQGLVISTPNRKSLWSIQTPQAFILSTLKMAYEQAYQDRFLGTDDASLVERMQIEIQVVEGDYQNIKITTPEDLIVANTILEHWSE